MSEQWKSDGDCPKCKRFTYCKTTCNAQKRAVEEHIKKILRRKIAETFSSKLPQNESDGADNGDED
jgi:radical SAM protein with 4Fe4S-binding SPASM domain